MVSLYSGAKQQQSGARAVTNTQKESKRTAESKDDRFYGPGNPKQPR